MPPLISLPIMQVQGFPMGEPISGHVLVRIQTRDLCLVNTRG